MNATRGTFPTPPTLPRLSRATSVRTGAALTGQSSPRVLACPTCLGWWDPFPPKYPPCPLLSQPTPPHATLHTSTGDHSPTLYHRVSLNSETCFNICCLLIAYSVCFGCLNLSGKRTNVKTVTKKWAQIVSMGNQLSTSSFNFLGIEKQLMQRCLVLHRASVTCGKKRITLFPFHQSQSVLFMDLSPLKEKTLLEYV